MGDLLAKHKEVHLKLKKDTHTSLRILLFRKRLSIQEVFEEFATLLIKESPYAMRIIDTLVLDKAKGKIKKVKEENLSILDQETLYNLIEEQSLKKSEEALEEESKKDD